MIVPACGLAVEGQGRRSSGFFIGHGERSMTDNQRTRGDSVRVAYPLFQEGGGGSIPTSPLCLTFHRTPRETFERFNRAIHSRLPSCGNWKSLRICYHAEYEDVIYAVAAWSNPVARMLPQDTWLELRRFAIADDAPKNTASRMLGWMTRDIANRWPSLERLISYQDCDVHQGTIYKASGWTLGNVGERIEELGGWKSRPNRTNQSTAPKSRWELDLTTRRKRKHKDRTP